MQAGAPRAAAWRVQFAVRNSLLLRRAGALCAAVSRAQFAAYSPAMHNLPARSVLRSESCSPAVHPQTNEVLKVKMDQISQELDNMACELIAFAVTAFEQAQESQQTQTAQIMPVLLAMDCEDEFLTFEQDTPDECYRAACEHVAKAGAACLRYAIVYDALVQEEQNKDASAALVVEFAERGMLKAWSGYMLYRRAEDGAIELSDPLPAGQEELLFAG